MLLVTTILIFNRRDNRIVAKFKGIAVVLHPEKSKLSKQKKLRKR
jgi:RNA polymerase subunit RPABC4/transcription elongation factor Spt4